MNEKRRRRNEMEPGGSVSSAVGMIQLCAHRA
jgi:hypothetical protein